VDVQQFAQLAKAVMFAAICCHLPDMLPIRIVSAFPGALVSPSGRIADDRILLKDEADGSFGDFPAVGGSVAKDRACGRLRDAIGDFRLHSQPPSRGTGAVHAGRL
jgi:hypothetical protein